MTDRECYLLERCLRMEAEVISLRAPYRHRPAVTAEDIAAMQALRDRGMFTYEVAARLGWGVSTVQKYTRKI